MSLTVTKINNAKPIDKPYKLTDGAGLFLLVNPSGSKLWKIKYRFQSKERQYAAGSFTQVSLAEAREANNHIKKLLAAGVDPTQNKRLAKQQRTESNQNTFGAIARSWLNVKRAGEGHVARSLRRMELHVFPRLGSYPISDIKTADIANCLEAVDQDGVNVTAKIVKQIIQQTFRYAVRKGIIEHNPAGDLRDIITHKKVTHRAAIPPQEIPALLQKIDAYQGEKLTKYALWLLAHTFVRTSELILAKWDEIDFDRQEWMIPPERMKMRQQHLVPLSRQTLKFFEELHGITGRHGYVFFSPANKSKCISNNAVLSALKRMGYRGRMTGHGFRSLASTSLNGQRKYHPDIIERQLAHGDSDEVRAAYNRADYLLERKMMMQEWSDFLDSAKAQKANVPKLERRPAINKQQNTRKG